jgi:hypothetical protein
LIPFNLDGPFTGREGSILNTHQGMKGLFVQAQPNLDRVFCVYLQNWSNEAAVTIDNQNPAHPQGSGGGIAISDYGANKAAVTLSKLVTPSARSPLLRLSNVSGGSGVLLTVGNTPTRNNLTIDDTGALRWASQGNPSDLAMYRVRAGVLRLDGAIELSASSGGYVPPLGLGAPAANTLSFHTAGSERIRVTPTGGVGIGGITPFGGRLLQVGESVAGVSNSLSLQNYHQADGDSVQIEMVDNNRQFATVRGIFTSSANAGALSFQVRDASANALQERLRLSGLGIGFFGSAPAGRPVVSGARGGNAALSSLLRALASLGLITDSTTS